MQVVSNRVLSRASFGQIRAKQTPSVEPIPSLKRKEHRNDRPQKEATLRGTTSEKRANGPLQAQVFATLLKHEVAAKFDHGIHLVGTSAYGESLERKVHKMAKGSFCSDCA